MKPGATKAVQAKTWLHHRKPGPSHPAQADGAGGNKSRPSQNMAPPPKTRAFPSRTSRWSRGQQKPSKPKHGSTTENQGLHIPHKPMEPGATKAVQAKTWLHHQQRLTPCPPNLPTHPAGSEPAASVWICEPCDAARRTRSLGPPPPNSSTNESLGVQCNVIGSKLTPFVDPVTHVARVIAWGEMEPCGSANRVDLPRSLVGTKGSSAGGAWRVGV
jgi:hypothetical protein